MIRPVPTQRSRKKNKAMSGSSWNSSQYRKLFGIRIQRTEEEGKQLG
jgi:hypothetical protein